MYSKLQLYGSPICDRIYIFILIKNTSLQFILHEASSMEENKELKRIKNKKLKELMRTTINREKKKMDQNSSGSHLHSPLEVNDSTLMTVIQNYPLVVIDCWAAWCGPCRIIAPIINELARDYAGRIVFGKLNVDQNKNVAMQYQIMSIPTLLVFKNGKLVDRIIGAMPRSTLEQRIMRYL
jgi:thioredoxin 1